MAMTSKTGFEELITLERSGWQALSTDGPTAASFYGDVLAREVLVLLPGGMVIDDRATMVESMQGDPWDSFDLQDERVMPFGDSAAVVAYRAVARRNGQEYAALCNSTYVRQDGQWKLALHQQTPI